MNVILKSDFLNLLDVPGFVDIQVFCTGQKKFTAVINHRSGDNIDSRLMGVLIDDVNSPFTDTDINRFLMKLQSLIEGKNNVRIHELNINNNLLNETMH